MKPIIATDIDGVLASTWDDFIADYNARNRTQFTIADIRAGSAHNQMEIPKTRLEFHITEFIRRVGLKNFRVYEGALDALARISNTWDVCAITARQDWMHEETREWIGEKFGRYIKEIYFSTNAHTHGASSSQTKIDICRQLDARFMIEDDPAYGIPVAEAGIRTILLNADTALQHPQIFHVKSWKEIETHIPEY